MPLSNLKIKSLITKLIENITILRIPMTRLLSIDLYKYAYYYHLNFFFLKSNNNKFKYKTSRFIKISKILSFIIFLIVDLTLKLLKNHKNTISRESVSSMLRVSVKEKTNIVLTSS